jgi:hypothetical protein
MLKNNRTATTFNQLKFCCPRTSVTSLSVIHRECSGWFDEKQISYMSQFPKIKCCDGSRQGDTFHRNQFNDGGSERREIVQRCNKLTCKNQQLINFYNAQKRNKDALMAWCMATVPSSIPRVRESSLCCIYWSNIKSFFIVSAFSTAQNYESV